VVHCKSSAKSLCSRYCLTSFAGAANRSPDSCTSDPDAARRLYVTSTKHLAKCTSSRSILLIYISTDYVFPGIRGQAPYKWADCPQPPNVYGQTKLDGEEALLNYTEGTGLGVVLRVPVLYGHVEPEGNNKESAVNVIMDALWKSQDKLDAPNAEKVKMDDWAQRYPTNTEDIGRVCVEISKHYLGVLATGDVQAKMDLPFILQFSSEDKMTKYEICQVFAEIMGLSMDGVVPEKDGGGGASGTVRPYDCHLDTSRLKELGIDISTANFVMWWRREVRAFRH
jgi:S-adenosylmethionine synthetase